MWINPQEKIKIFMTKGLQGGKTTLQSCCINLSFVIVSLTPRYDYYWLTCEGLSMLQKIQITW
jgi:hypothetical protein